MNDPISNALSAAIIAGGKSRRYGEPKALALLKGESLVDISIRTAKAISLNIFLNYGVINLYADKDVPLIPDIIPGCGPLGGIYTVLNHAKTPWVAVLPCDLPLLPPRVYRLLFEYCRESRPVVALSHRGMEPLVSIWPKTAAEQLKKSLQKNQLALYPVIQALQAVEVHLLDKLPGYQPYFFFNINRKEDLEKITQIIEKKDLSFGLNDDRNNDL